MSVPLLASPSPDFKPPQNLEAEQGLLGALLMDSRNASRVRHLVKADQFSYPIHGVIYRACLDLIDVGTVPNPTTLKTKFENGLDEVGGPQYLAGLMGFAPVPQSVESYARVVHDLATRRQLWHLCMTYAAEACNDGDMSADEVTAALLADAQMLCRDTGKTKIQSRRDVLLEIAEGQKRPQPFYPTGLKCLDDAMGGGLFAKRVYGLAARKKAGKTALMATISHNLNNAGVKHLYICLEMSPVEIEHRKAARDMKINSIKFLKPEDTPFVTKTAEYALKSPDSMYYWEAPGQTFQEIKRVVSLAVAQYGIKGFFIDYLQLMGGKGNRQTTAEFMDETAQWCANFAREQGIWAVVASQVNQEGNTRGGEGMLLAFDQVYRLSRAGDEENPEPGAWLEMMASRYTPAQSLGNEGQPALFLDPRGPYFAEAVNGR